MIACDGFAKAAQLVRSYIEEFDLVAGCGSSGEVFTGGRLFLDADRATQVGRVSYNGRVWDMGNQPITI